MGQACRRIEFRICVALHAEGYPLMAQSKAADDSEGRRAARSEISPPPSAAFAIPTRSFTADVVRTPHQSLDTATATQQAFRRSALN